MSIDDTAHPGAPSDLPLAEAELPWNHPLARGLSRLGRRLKQGDRKHPWVLDTSVIVVVALMFCVPDLVHDDDGRRRAFDTQVTHLP
ncbi:sensor histidine kinase, partial [Streptomyces sp. NPDC057927]